MLQSVSLKPFLAAVVIVPFMQYGSLQGVKSQVSSPRRLQFTYGQFSHTTYIFLSTCMGYTTTQKGILAAGHLSG